MKAVTEIVMWFFLGSLAVLVVMHARGFSEDVTAVGTQLSNMGTILTGANVQNAAY